MAASIVKLPHVAAISSQFVELLSIESSQMMMLSGRQWDGYAWNNLKLISGRMPLDAKEKAVVLGTLAAETLQKKPGDTVQIEGVVTHSEVGFRPRRQLQQHPAITTSLALVIRSISSSGAIPSCPCRSRCDPMARSPHHW